ncbi:uncharacterized protein N7482_000042 [Penicillium canariense]|uniref:Uncharacterized protein n=1 Tax=Penicillium canariense TaxID=189055 RepID=A0A9W9IB22_9EURO|nr:uncharacterized protein N7482_000042 [Penicillium canariense]KAJ5174165.1 hypothetical protein N7482_000042 [Penicillium canariense]
MDGAKNTLILSRDVAEEEKEAEVAGNAKQQQHNEILRWNQIKEQENKKWETELSCETGEDGEPLYCLDI